MVKSIPALITKKLTELLPDEKNANQGTELGLRLLDDSLQEDGAGRGILLDKNGKIIAGNKTVERAVDDGFEDVIIDFHQAIERGYVQLSHQLAELMQE